MIPETSNIERNERGWRSALPSNLVVQAEQSVGRVCVCATENNCRTFDVGVG